MIKPQPKWKTKALNIIKCNGFPAPEMEYLFAKPRMWKFDLAYPLHQIAIEYEGILNTGGIRVSKAGKLYANKSRHTTPSGYTNDCKKYFVGNLLGWKIIRITALSLDDGTFGRMLRMALSNQSNDREWLTQQIREL